MVRGGLRRFDVQAQYALIFSLASVVFFIGTAAMLARNWNTEQQRFVYGGSGVWLPVFLGFAGVALLLGVIGFLLGWNSAGQRRNAKSSWSWAAFFVGGLISTLSLVCLIAFVVLRLSLAK